MSSYDFSFSSLQQKIEALRESFDKSAMSLAKELDQARDAVADLQGAEDGMTARLEQAEQRIVAQDELIETLNQELQEARVLRKDVRDRELEIERMRSELETKNELVGTVRRQLKKANEQSSALQKRLDETREQSADATAMDNAEIVALKAELEARRTMIKSLREDVARTDRLEEQLESKRQNISMLEESIDQHVQTIAELRKSADAWKLKYLAVKGESAPNIDDTLTEQPEFTDTEIEALREFDPSSQNTPEATVAIDMRGVFEPVPGKQSGNKS